MTAEQPASRWPPPAPLPRAALIAALALAYFVTARLGLMLAIPGGHVTPVWPPTGLALAALLLWGRGLWPGVMLGSFAANAWGMLGSPLGLPTELGTAAAIAAGGSATALLGHALLHRWVGPRHPLERARDVGLLLGLGGALSCIVSASVGVTALCVAGFAPWAAYGGIWLTWWLGDTAGVFVVAPLLLAWLARPALPGVGARLEALACAGVLLLVCGVVFLDGSLKLAGGSPLSFVLIPCLAWPALRFGQRGATAAIALVALVAVLSAVHAAELASPASRDAALLLLEALLSVVAATALCLAALATERRQAEAVQACALATLEARVQARTASLRQANTELHEQIAQREAAQARADRLLAETERARLVLLSLLEDQKLTESRLRDSEAYFRAVVESSPLGIFIVDPDGANTYNNRAILRMTGLTAEGISGSGWVSAIHPDDRARVLAERQASTLRGEPYEGSGRWLHGDGRIVWWDMTTAPVHVNGRLLGHMGMVLDITHRKSVEAAHATLEAQLRQAQKMEAVGTLAGGIAHDFNNILGAILGHAALAEHELPPAHAVHENLVQIMAAGRRARSLVDRILAFSRRQAIALENQPLQPMVTEALAMLRATLPTIVSLRPRLVTTPLHVFADATQIQQVLLNLCTNAWHAMRGSSGHIEVGLEEIVSTGHGAEHPVDLPPGAFAHLWVRDDGSGMDAATVARIFEPFFTTKPAGEGTGLGLAAVHGIVSAHHGSITVDSTPGRGTTFHLYLPLVAADSAPPAAPAATPVVAAGDGCRVLYLDDDETMALVVEQLLRRAGYLATIFQDAQRALAAVRAEPQGFDIVVTDFNMPRLSGLDVARQLAEIRADLPVIISSGYIDSSLRADSEKTNVRALLNKERTAEDLIPLIAGVMAVATASA